MFVGANAERWPALHQCVGDQLSRRQRRARFTVTTAGTPTPAITVTGTLPAGVTFVDNGDGTATLAGTPAAGPAARIR